MIKPSAFLLLFFILKFALIFAFGLGVDEAHYMLYARYIDLSYFDHPPLVGWVHYIFNTPLGENLFSARIPAYLLGIVISIYLYRYLKLYFNANEAMFGVLAMNSSVMLSALFLFLLPETLLLFLLFPILFSVTKLEEEGSVKNYLILGFWLGVAGLAKYSAILFIPPILLYLFLKKRLEIILSYKTILAILLALLLVMPVIYWNIQNNFISFSYQGQNVGGGSFSFDNFFESLGGQLSYSPLLFLVAIFGFWRVWVEIYKKREYRFLLPFLLGVTFSLIFIYFSFFDTVLPHWSAAFYILFIPIGAIFLLRAKERVAKWAVYLSFLLIIIIFLELIFKVVPYRDYSTPFKDIVGWDSIMDRAKEIVATNPGKNKALAVTNWTKGSRAIYYYKGEEPIFVLDDRVDQFDLWERGDFVGYDLLLIIETNSKRFDKESISCKRIEKVSTMDIKVRKSVINSVTYYWCYGFGGKR